LRERSGVHQKDFMEMGVVEMNYVAIENLAFNDRYELPKNAKPAPLEIIKEKVKL